MSARFLGYVGLCAAVAAGLLACGKYGIFTLVVSAVLIFAYPTTRLQIMAVWYMVRACPSRRDGSVSLELDQPVEVRFCERGIPTIEARSRLDAACALGFVVARERMFQLEWLRRRAAGRLAELLGPCGVSLDRQMRRAGLSQTAGRITESLPQDQRELLEAFSRGVNAFIDRGPAPFEFRVLRHKPERWTPRDSVLVLQGMFHLLHGDIDSHRMRWIMEKSLPDAIVEFLLNHDASMLIPVDELKQMLAEGNGESSTGSLDPQGPVCGSNACAVAGSNTADGRAVVANDLHLPLTIPATFFAVRLCYEDVDVSGVVVPGIPFVLSGSNRHLAWGVTNLPGGCLDLVPIERDRNDVRRYRRGDDWDSIEPVDEVIRVRGSSDVVERVEWTAFGPIVQRDLLGYDLALQWSALLASAVDLTLAGLHEATGLDQGLDIVTSAGSPPLNVVLAEKSGAVARTVTGRFPLRDSNRCWVGWIQPEGLPRQVDPPEGFVASANEANPLAFNPSPRHRIDRLVERLTAGPQTPSSLSALQLDIESPCLATLRDLALAAIPRTASEQAAALRAWDGRATLDCVVLAWLYAFRLRLAAAVFDPILDRCYQAVPDFRFEWNDIDTPLLTMLRVRPPFVPGKYATWDELIASQLQAAANDVRERHGRVLVPWKKVNQVCAKHALWQALQLLRPLLAWPRFGMPGGPTHLWNTSCEFGAATRIVAIPGAPEENILQIVGGQSGHIASANFLDQLWAWRKGKIVQNRCRTKYTLTLKASPHSTTMKTNDNDDVDAA